mgnify:CR=1 FL=1
MKLDVKLNNNTLDQYDKALSTYNEWKSFYRDIKLSTLLEGKRVQFDVDNIQKIGMVNDFVTLENPGKMQTMAFNISGMTFYQYKDAEPFAGKNYYRLKMVDKSGLADYSSIKFVQMDENYALYKMYPNPTFSKVTLLGAEKIDEVQLVNSLGMVVYQKKIDPLGNKIHKRTTKYGSSK